MKRPFLTFLACVVLPSGLAIWAADRAAQTAHDEMWLASAKRSARLTLGTLEEDLGAAVDALLESAEPFEPSDSTSDATRRALAGDTVTALDPTVSGLEVLVLFGVPEEPGTLRYNEGVIAPGGPTLVGRMTRSAIGIYAAGRLMASSDSVLDLETVTSADLLAAAAGADGVPLHGGVLMAMDPRPGLEPAIAVFARPYDSDGAAVSLPVRLVMGLLLFFAALAGWIQLTGQGRTRKAGSVAAVTLLAIVPAAATSGLLAHVVRDFDESSVRAIARDLTRSLGVVEALDLSGSPERIRGMSGFHAARIERGRVTETTLSGVEDALAALPVPPPSFTTSGRVSTSEGEAHYVGRRLGPGATLVVVAPEPYAARERLRTSAAAIGLGLWSWLALVGAVLMLRRRPRPAEGTTKET